MLKLVDGISSNRVFDAIQGQNDHDYLLGKFIESHKIRNHSQNTIKKYEQFLRNWFDDHGRDALPLLTWEAMEVVRGRSIIQSYISCLLKGDFATKTIRDYLNILSSYFSYVLEYPYLKRENDFVHIEDLYDIKICQSISEWDYPNHHYSGEQQGVPFDPSRLYEFYSVVKSSYVDAKPNCPFRARNYTMVVIAGESGLRLNELLNLHIEDLLFESKKLQTRFAKSSRGSGKKSRVTLFSPLARDSVQFYLKNHRSFFLKQETSLVFPSKSGQLLSQSLTQEFFKKLLNDVRRAKFPVLDHMSWHWFRRIFATRFIEEFPGKLSVLIELLGHSNYNTVHRYICHSKAWMDCEIQKVIEGDR